LVFYGPKSGKEQEIIYIPQKVADHLDSPPPFGWDLIEYHKKNGALIYTELFTVSVLFRSQIFYRYHIKYLQFRLICD
jgi:hypothetical protein